MIGTWVLMLSISLFGGAGLAQIVLSKSMQALKVKEDETLIPSWYSGFVVGLVERLFFTVAVALGGVSGVIPAMLIWVTLKGQTHYNIFNGVDEGRKNRKNAYAALMASLISLLVALICGYILYARRMLLYPN
jgi:hypothetical protein